MQQDATLFSFSQQLAPSKRRAIDALLLTGRIGEAAEAVGISRSTLGRWLRDPVFRQALREAEAAALDELQRRLVALGGSAADALAAALKHDDVRIKLRAADVTLTRLLQLRELVDLEERLARLEAQAQGGPQR